MTVQRPIISFDKVKVCRGKKCVLDIDGLTIDQGQLVAVMGPNGSGKSTLLQAINGLLPVQEGTVTVLGQALASNNLVRLRRQSAMVRPTARGFSPRRGGDKALYRCRPDQAPLQGLWQLRDRWQSRNSQRLAPLSTTRYRREPIENKPST